jgi:carboxyl-terminal processing protease
MPAPDVTPLRATALALAFLACQQARAGDAGGGAALVGGAESAVRQEANAAGAWSAAEALAAFDEAWQRVHDTHFDAGFNGVDWDAVRAELRPRAEAARDRGELRAVIGEMLGRLGQSHFALIPSDALPEEAQAGHDESGGLGFDVRLREGRLLVSALEPGSAAADAGVAPGWIVERIGPLDVAGLVADLASAGMDARRVAFNAWQVARGAVLGRPGGSETVLFRDAAGAPVELRLERRARDVTEHEVGPTLPKFYLEFASRELERGGKHVGLLRFSNWFLPMVRPLDLAVDRMRALDGIVLDLRGNTGGAAAMTMGVAGHFFGETRKLGVMLTRDSRVNILAFPRRSNPAGEAVEPYAGPLAILLDETSGSASEVFAGGMQALGRARVFGETSAGAVLPAMVTRLPNGDTLLHALGDFETATGMRLEGAGVVPDVPAPLSRAELLAGRDPALEAALDWIASMDR